MHGHFDFRCLKIWHDISGPISPKAINFNVSLPGMLCGINLERSMKRRESE